MNNNKSEPVFRCFKPDEAATVYDWGVKCENASNSVLLEIDGFHGTFINSASVKKYILVDGSVDVSRDGETENHSAPDSFEIDKHVKHSLTGHKARLICIVEPPFSPETEEVL